MLKHSELKFSLNDYILWFSAFSPENKTTSTNPLEKVNCAKKIYSAVNARLDKLENWSKDYPQLPQILQTLKELNELAAALIMRDTKGSLKINDDLSLDVAQFKIQELFMLAKKCLQNPTEFLTTIDHFCDLVQKERRLTTWGREEKYEYYVSKEYKDSWGNVQVSELWGGTADSHKPTHVKLKLDESVVSEYEDKLNTLVSPLYAFRFTEDPNGDNNYFGVRRIQEKTVAPVKI